MTKLRTVGSLLLVSALWLVGCTASGEDETSTVAQTTDPESAAVAVSELHEEAVDEAPLVDIENPVVLQAGWGSAFDGAPILEKIPDHSEAVVRGQLVRVGKTRLNTASGEWEALADPVAQLNQRAGLLVMTELEIRVHEVLGKSQVSRVSPEVGNSLNLTILGGLAEFTVSPEEAKATGLRPDISDEDEQELIDSGDVPDPNEPNPAPERAFVASLETPYFVSLTEGDEVIVFLRVSPMFDISKNDGSNYDSTILAPTHEMGQGIFVIRNGDYVEATAGEVVSAETILTMADSVSSGKNRVDSPGPIGLFQP